MVKSSGGRTVRDPQSASLGTVLTATLLAVAGQCFLSQSQILWTLWPGIGLMAAALWQSRRALDSTITTGTFKGERLIFALVILLAVFFHFWRLGEFPAGLHQDLGEMGLCAMRIWREGWRPLEEAFQYPTPFLTDFYSMAAWFALVGSSLFSIQLFFILFSLAALPVLYLFFRKLAGVPAALLTLFFFATMRWQWVEARNPHPSCEAPLYVLGVMALLLAGFQNRKPLYLAGAAFVSGLGLYAYQSLKSLFLLMAAIALFEYFQFPKDRKGVLKALKWVVPVFLILALPLIKYFFDEGTLGQRESGAFILPTLLLKGSLMPLLQSVVGAALMLNRAADMDPFHNLPGHRMLDDVTGVLFWIGLALAWRWRKERRGAYPLLGFGVMLLPGLLTNEGWATQRYTGILPFVAYFAALGTVGLGNAFARAWKGKRTVLWVAGVLLVAAVTAQNAFTYFGLEASNPRCQKAAGPEQTFIGREIARMEKEEPGRYRYLLDPFYQHNPTVGFLGYAVLDRTGPFLVSDWAEGKMPHDKDCVLFLAEGKSGTWLFLKSLFPDGQGGLFRKLDGQAGLYLEKVPASDLERFRPWDRGLQGAYFQAGRWTDPPAFFQKDPLINFSSREDFPLTGDLPYRVLWMGRLQINTPGDYAFNLLCPDEARLWLDGKKVSPEIPVHLSAGFHPLRLEYDKTQGYYTALHLVWKTPHGSDWEVVPAEAFGRIEGRK